MEKISNYISKKVITLGEGENAGYILNVVFDSDLNKLIGLVIVDDESDKVFLLKKENIKAAGEDCIIITSTDNLDFYLEDECYNPIGKQVYDINGLSLGMVIDVLLQGNVVKRIVTTKCEFFKRNIRKLGKKYIIFGSKEKKRTKKSTNIFKIENKKLPNVYIQNQSQGIIENNSTKIKPYRIFANQNSIMGRTMVSDLYGYNNEIIAKKYDIINQNIINRAKLHNKLNFLLYYSK